MSSTPPDGARWPDVVAAPGADAGAVVGDHRLRLLATLATALADASDPDEVARRAVKALAGTPALPFVQLHLAGPDGLRPAAADGGDVGPAPADGWPVSAVLADGVPRLLPPRSGDGSTTPVVAVLPVPDPGGDRPAGVLVAALDPGGPVDADDRTFVELVAAQIGTALALVRERRRRAADPAAPTELRLFQALVERSGDFIAVATPDGRTVYVNPAGRALVGLGDAEPVDGLGLVDFAAPDARERWRTELIPSALREGHHRAESRLVHRDTGAAIDVDHQTFTVATDGRDATAFVATVARDVSERQRALRRAEALARLAAALSSARGHEAIVEVVTTVAPAVVDAVALRVALALPGRTVLDVAGGDTPAERVPVGADAPLARAVRDNAVLPLTGVDGRTTGLCLPLRYGDGVALGALEVRWAGPVAEDEAPRNLLDAVAGLCSQALQRAELTGSAQAMAGFAARLSVTRSTTEAIEVILDAATTALGAELPGLAMRDEGRRVRLWYHDDVPGTLAATFHDLTVDDPRPIVRALRSGERIVLRDRADFAARFPGLADPVGAHGLVTTVALPLFGAGRRPIAALGFGWRRERPLREGDLALLDTVADLCEQTLERVRLAAAEHNLVTRLAGRLRSSSLTTPHGLEVATRYRPAMSGLHLGGDWYDLVRQEGDRLAVVLGDVVGHQVEAAADMAQLRTMLNTLIRLGVPLEEVFLRLTELLGVGFLGTCVVVVVDPRARTAQVARAGHPHPVVLPAGAPPRTVQTENAMPLGMVDRPMTVTTIPFAPGDLLVAYTDGLVERRGRPYDEGVAALHRALEAVRDEPAEVIADELLRDLAGSEDDQALVVLRHLG
ncbi:SpoIIE family protein phosphatase [Micromonospora maritima]|uniref:SpoIIE family protein phosphatase n=1 Tax=Micromonospora maritima TaxID=986711 RepID=UPI0037996C0A